MTFKGNSYGLGVVTLADIPALITPHGQRDSLRSSEEVKGGQNQSATLSYTVPLTPSTTGRFIHASRISVDQNGDGEEDFVLTQSTSVPLKFYLDILYKQIEALPIGHYGKRLLLTGVSRAIKHHGDDTSDVKRERVLALSSLVEQYTQNAHTERSSIFKQLLSKKIHKHIEDRYVKRDLEKELIHALLKELEKFVTAL